MTQKPCYSVEIIRLSPKSSGKIRLNVGTETFVGAQATGIVDKLFVREGDRVTAGQQLAILKNDVAEAQVAQAQQAVRTA